MRRNKERILVVDDEPQVLVALEDLLSDEFSILKTNSPTEALEVVRSTPDIAVVVTDQRMPTMTGDKLLAHVEGASGALGIMITGFADLNAVVRAVNEGRLFAYVTKPWDADDLKFKVHQAAERFRLSQELAYERQLLHDLMDNVPDGIYFKDRAHRLLRANQAHARALGYDDSDALMQDMERGRSSALQRETERSVMETGVAATDQVREQATEGGWRWVSETIAPVRDHHSRVVGIVGIARDVTERMRVDAALRRSEIELRAQTRLLTSILESIGEGVVVVDKTGRFILCNDQAEKLLGLSLNRGHQVDDWAADCGLFLANQSTPVTKETDPLARALAHQETSTLEVYVLNSRAKGTILMVTATPLRRAESPGSLGDGAVAVLRDVTRERDLERQFLQSQKMEAVGRLAGGVAHDFNNLLSIIQSYGELLLGQFENEDVRRSDLVEMLSAADRAANLTRQLLSFSRNGVVQPHLLQLNAVVEGVQRMLQRTLGEDIALITELQEGLPNIAADTGQLEQVILNLAVNARDALPNGGRLEIRTSVITSTEVRGLTSPSDECEYVLMRVEDNGTGMSDEVCSRIFEPFFTTKQVGKGTGIGLSTVYGIVHRYGGTIWVTSELGMGTVFHIAFPAAGEQAWRPVVRRSGPPASAPGKTILLVEDEDEVRRVAARILREEGYVVIEARDAASATEACEEQAVDLLLTDVVMSGVNGFELADQLTRRFPRLHTLFMSGYPGDRVEGLHLVDEKVYIEKPLTRKKLLSHVSKTLAPR